jgi:hypothetical protein
LHGNAEENHETHLDSRIELLPRNMPGDTEEKLKISTDIRIEVRSPKSGKAEENNGTRLDNRIEVLLPNLLGETKEKRGTRRDSLIDI